MTGAEVGAGWDTVAARARMVERQLAARDVRAPEVLAAMGEVPREAFVSEAMAEFAYEDSPLPIEAGQTISQPYIVGLMVQAAELRPGDRVLEIGAGSGYAAAVMSRIAAHVYAIERHAELSDLARRRLDRLGYHNVEIRTGDGSRGWPDQAPFDAILAAAGGPEVPDVLRRQLAIGGRLVMPVGSTPRQQTLVKLTRLGEDEYREEDLGGVKFVPLIGEHGWAEDERGGPRAPRRREGRGAPPRPASLPRMIAAAAEPLPEIDDPAFARAFDRFADARVVLLGESTHGTAEFYRARAAVTRRLIERHGFQVVAVEADWPDAAVVDRWVRGRPATPGEPPFARFPAWMWRNREVDAFVRWLRAWNAERPAGAAGFHGLDLYNLNASIGEVLAYLDRVDPEAAAAARERYGCLAPWRESPAAYGRMATRGGEATCEEAVAATLRHLLERRQDYVRHDGESFLDAAQNARLVKGAEAYYRAMYRGAAESWNLRDRHMFETLRHLLEAGGPDARAVVWAHNSHIGDARFTEMGVVREELNLGQLCRETYGPEAVLVGFGTHAGTVAAASDWDGPMELKSIRPSLPGSIERLSHDAGGPRWLLDLRPDAHPELRERLVEPRLQRFIGVIYRPETERWSHYAEASVSRQYDAWVWFDETSAVTPLPGEIRPGEDDTWPFGL